MGAIVNAVRIITPGMSNVGGVTLKGRIVGGRKFSTNVTHNLNKGSKVTPIVGECRNMTEGIAKGDF